MRVFNSDDWVAAKKRRISLSGRDQVQIRVSCPEMVSVFGVRGEEKVPLHFGSTFRLRDTFQGFEAVELSAKVEFGSCVTWYEYQDGEPINHDNPPAPPLPGAENLVAQFQRMLRDNARRQADPYMEPEALPFGERYHYDDDDELFEEELYKRELDRREAAKKKAADEKKKAAAAGSSSQPATSEGGAATAGAGAVGREPSSQEVPGPQKPPEAAPQGGGVGTPAE